MARFLHGTAGWSYADWVGPFYEGGTPEGAYLERYAARFPAAEVDSTYYRTPPAKMVKRWAEVTPDGFVFSPKMVGEVTHERFLADCDDLVEKFMAAMKPLGAKLSWVVLQFPYYKKADGVTLEGFLARLVPFLDRHRDDPFAVEVRNKTFLKPELIKVLAERETPLVLVDHVWMPPPAGYRGMFTATTVPVRLLGDRYGIEKITTKWEKVVVDREDRLREWANLIRAALDEGRDVQAFANNHFAGYAPATAARLAELVLDGGVPGH